MPSTARQLRQPPTIEAIGRVPYFADVDYLRIALTLKTRHLIVGRRNNYSFLVLYKSRYLIYLPKHLIKLVFIKRIIIQRVIHKRI